MKGKFSVAYRILGHNYDPELIKNRACKYLEKYNNVKDSKSRKIAFVHYI